MSLHKQLVIVFSAILLMAFSANCAITIKHLSSDLQAEAQAHARETASSLGHALSPYILHESDPILKTMIGAIFGMGNFKEIKLENASEKTLVKLTDQKHHEEVPDWFIQLAPIDTASAESEISSGWTFGGTVYVTVNKELVYVKLYQQARTALFYSLGAFLLSISLLIHIVRFTLKPLQNINAFAQSIAGGDFDTIAPLPWATEIRSVAHSINVMSQKLNSMTTHLEGKLSLLGQKLQVDSQTGLLNKNTFDSDLKRFCLENTEAYLFLIKIDSLSDLVKELDSDAIDALLQNYAVQLKQSAQNFSRETTAYHFYGAEFALLTPHTLPLQARKLAKALSMTLSEFGQSYYKADFGHIGIVAISPMDEWTEMLAAANEAYELASITGPNCYYFRTGDDRAKDITEWKSMVIDVVERNAYKVQFMARIQTFDDCRILLEEAFIQAFDAQGTPLPTGIFISIAEKYEKIIALDKGLLAQVMDYLKGNPSSFDIAVNLSTRTVKNSAFRTWLAHQLNQDNSLAPRLIISLSAYAVAKDLNTYAEFIKFVHTLGLRVVLKRFETQSLGMDQLKSLKPDFIRLSRELTTNLDGDAEKIAFLQAVKETGDLLEISILAENIKSDTDFTLAKIIGLAGASR